MRTSSGDDNLAGIQKFHSHSVARIGGVGRRRPRCRRGMVVVEAARPGLRAFMPTLVVFLPALLWVEDLTEAGRRTGRLGLRWCGIARVLVAERCIDAHRYSNGR